MSEYVKIIRNDREHSINGRSFEEVMSFIDPRDYTADQIGLLFERLHSEEDLKGLIAEYTRMGLTKLHVMRFFMWTLSLDIKQSADLYDKYRED